MESKNDLPKNLFYNQDYSWIKIDQGEAVLGLIKPAADKVQEFVFIDLPKKGQKLNKGDTYASLEAIKWSGHLSSPLSGEVIEVNDDLFDEPGIINEDPYGKGWIAKLKLSEPKEKEELLLTEQIKEWVDQKTDPK
jgi:glycine cleavage system H protein